MSKLCPVIWNWATAALFKATDIHHRWKSLKANLIYGTLQFFWIHPPTPPLSSNEKLLKSDKRPPDKKSVNNSSALSLSVKFIDGHVQFFCMQILGGPNPHKSTSTNNFIYYHITPPQLSAVGECSSQCNQQPPSTTTMVIIRVFLQCKLQHNRHVNCPALYHCK